MLDECDDLARLSTAEGRGKARNVPDRVFLSFHGNARNGTDPQPALTDTVTGAARGRPLNPVFDVQSDGGLRFEPFHALGPGR